MKIQKRVIELTYLLIGIFSIHENVMAKIAGPTCAQNFEAVEVATSIDLQAYNDFVTAAFSNQAPKLVKLLLSRASKRWKSSKDWRLVAQKISECPDVMFKSCFIDLSKELEHFDISIVVDQSEDTMAISVTSIRLKVLNVETGEIAPLAYNSETEESSAHQGIGLNVNFMNLISVVVEKAFETSQERSKIKKIIFVGDLVLNDRLIEMLKNFGFKQREKKWFTEISIPTAQ